MKTKITLTLGALVALLNCAPAYAGVTQVYMPEMEDVTDGKLYGWRKEGGFGDPASVCDLASNTASKLPALYLDSMVFEGGSSGADTKLIGNTEVKIKGDAGYRLSFILSRVGTSNTEDDLSFWGSLKYQLWAGDPKQGGVLLGEEREMPVLAGEKIQNGVLKLEVPAMPDAEGKILHIVIASGRTKAPEPQPFRYQQAEISDLVVEAVTR